MDKLQSLGFLLNRTSFALIKALRNEFRKRDIDLPHSQFIVLRTLYLEEAMSQQELATRMYKDAAAIKRTIDNLEEKGLVRREQASQRENTLIITDEGLKLAPIAIEYADALLDKILEPIDEVDMSYLYNLLGDIYLNAENVE